MAVTEVVDTYKRYVTEPDLENKQTAVEFRADIFKIVDLD